MKEDSKLEDTEQNKRRFILVSIDAQYFAFPVENIEDVLRDVVATPIPLAPSEISGSLNLRGRIVTVMDLRKKLGFNTSEAHTHMSGIVVMHENGLYCITMDAVHDVMVVDENDTQPLPENLSSLWSEVSSAVYPVGEQLVVILSTDKLLHVAAVFSEMA